MAGTKWLRAAEALAAEHVRIQREAGDGPDKQAFFRLWNEYQMRPRWLKSEMTEQDTAMVLSYAMAALAYTQPPCSRRRRVVIETDRDPAMVEDWSPAWVIEDHGLWAGGNTLGEGVVTP